MRIGKLPLSQRLSAVFAVLLLACCGASAWLQMRWNDRHEQEVTQRLSAGLAAHIAGNGDLLRAQGLNRQAVRDLFGKLMDVNPSVEVYLLAPDGRIEAHDAPAGHLLRDRVDLEPIRRLLAGAPLPITGDDPRSEAGTAGRKVFSAAPLRIDGRDAGFIYVVLQGENHAALARRIATDNVLRHTLWAMAVVAGLGLLAGLAAFHGITRPLRRLTGDVQRFHAGGDDRLAARHDDAAGAAAAPPSAAAAAGRDPGGGGGAVAAGAGHDEIATLQQAFARMTQRIAEQWRELTAQDQQRRELVANISHDLRTPLTSLHGYLETLRLKADTLSEADRRRYLDIALGQSRKVGRLAQQLFELARLEYGVVKPERERFALPELVQDVFQKFELAAEARQQRLVADIAPGLPVVSADLGMIERVLTNLLDNAIRHTPAGGRIEVRLRGSSGGDGAAAVEVQVGDDGPGIPERLRPTLFARPASHVGIARDADAGTDGAGSDRGGLGLVIVRRILQLHGSDIRLVERPERGAVFRFRLAAAGGR